MNKQKKLSNVWIKASILGANWAASEIILGSFLHNTHVPFKGNILTAIALVLLISVSFRWKDKGLFWRSGLICALMKTMSPSAVIFGPMVAIFMEALLLEFSVRLFGRNLAGFLIGSALAMTWILTQRIGNYIIFYGYNIVEIYADLLIYAERQLNLQFEMFWLPILILLALYILFGLFAAIAGMKIGKEVASSLEIETDVKKAAKFEVKKNQRKDFPYSIIWLLLSIAAFISTLFLISQSPIYIWMPAVTALLVVWVLRYKRALRQLSRPKFWIFFVVITALSAMLISSFSSDQNNWLEGLLVGLQMNFRAAVVIVGFTVLGTELYNPTIRNYLANSMFKQLPVALELAFDSLPYVIGHLPDARTFLRNPAAVIKVLIYRAELKFEELTSNEQPKVYIVTGDISKGKTSFLVELISKLQQKDFLVGGFYSPRILHNNQTIGYNLASIETGESYHFLSLRVGETDNIIGKYEVIKEGLKQGKKILQEHRLIGQQIVVIDEIGKLELKDGGWKNSLDQLLKSPELVIILAVRTEFVTRVVEKFNIRSVTIVPVSTANIEEVENSIENCIN